MQWWKLWTDWQKTLYTVCFNKNLPNVPPINCCVPSAKPSKNSSGPTTAPYNNNLIKRRMQTGLQTCIGW